MPTRDEMTIDERRKYVKLMSERYRKAKRKERSQLLSEMEQVSKLHRKHLIRLLNGESLERKTRSTLRSRSYGLEVERVVLRVWESQAFGQLWRAALDRRDREPTGDDQSGNGATHVAQEPRSQSAFTAPRPAPSQSGDQRSPDGTHPLGHERARPLRDRFGASWGREYSRRVWVHLATDRCGYWLERASNAPGTRATGDGSGLHPGARATALCGQRAASR